MMSNLKYDWNFWNPIIANDIYLLITIEYPAARGGKPEDKQNFVALLRELSQALSPRGNLLTAAVSAGKWFIDPAYDIPQISE